MVGRSEIFGWGMILIVRSATLSAIYQYSFAVVVILFGFVNILFHKLTTGCLFFKINSFFF